MLGSIEYSGDLASQLLAFSKKMEAVFQHLQTLRKNKSTDEKAYQKHFNIIDEKSAWYEKAEACLDSFRWEPILGCFDMI